MSAPYRRRLVALPLQISCFQSLDRVATWVEAEEVLPARRFDARLSEEGDLYLDAEAMKRVRAHVAEHVDDAWSERFVGRLDAACAALTRAYEQGPNTPALEAVEAWGAAIAGVLPFGLLTKFVPDALLQALAARGDTEPPPLPHPSPGQRLLCDVLRLGLGLLDAGEDLAKVGLHGETRPEIAAFCASHRGMGPLAWDAPGYEEPSYVARALRTTLGDLSRTEIEARLGRIAGAPVEAAVGEPSALRRALARTLAFLEDETALVRAAFFEGLLPALRHLAVERGMPREVAENLLFWRLEEMTVGAPTNVVARRRAAWEANDEHLRKHGIGAGRITALWRG